MKIESDTTAKDVCNKLSQRLDSTYQSFELHLYVDKKSTLNTQTFNNNSAHAERVLAAHERIADLRDKLKKDWERSKLVLSYLNMDGVGPQRFQLRTSPRQNIQVAQPAPTNNSPPARVAPERTISLPNTAHTYSISGERATSFLRRQLTQVGLVNPPSSPTSGNSPRVRDSLRNIFGKPDSPKKSAPVPATQHEVPSSPLPSSPSIPAVSLDPNSPENTPESKVDITTLPRQSNSAPTSPTIPAEFIAQDSLSSFLTAPNPPSQPSAFNFPRTNSSPQQITPHVKVRVRSLSVSDKNTYAKAIAVQLQAQETQSAAPPVPNLSIGEAKPLKNSLVNLGNIGSTSMPVLPYMPTMMMPPRISESKLRFYYSVINTIIGSRLR